MAIFPKTMFIFYFLIKCSSLSSTYEITVLATNIANFGGLGEWSFSALLEGKNESLIFDTGFDENTVLHNANLLGKDLGKVEKVILSHFHGDHTGGLLKLRKAFMTDNPKAFTKVYVANGFFDQRYDEKGDLRGFIGGFNRVSDFAAEASLLGINFIVVDGPLEISKNLVLSRPVERKFEKVIVSPGFFLWENGNLKADLVADDQSLGILTKKGWYIMSGCGHSGLLNTADAFSNYKNIGIYGLIGGLHLFRSSDDFILNTAKSLKRYGIQQIVGAHCTGIRAAQLLAGALDITDANLSHGAVGAVVTSDLKIVRSSVE